MMQRLDQTDQAVEDDRPKKSDCKPACAQLNDAYQKEYLKSDARKAFEARNSYSHGTIFGRYEHERMILYETKSLDGTKPNTNPETNPNPHSKLVHILTLFICFMLFSSTVP